MSRRSNIIDLILGVIAALAIVITFVFMVITMASCNPTKIAAKKDAQALDRVEGSLPLLSTAFAKGLELWPCVNDTVKSVRSDTVVTTQTFTDTVRSEFTQRDTLVTYQVRTVRIKDTILAYIKDGRVEKMLIDSLDAEHLRNAVQKGTIL